jgi:hypothetical protein
MSFGSAVVEEFRRALRPPYETPLVVAGNGLLVVFLWFTPLSSLMFTIHGALAFPIVLGSWMYADVPATNVLGSDPRVVTVLDDDAMLMRLLAAKSAVLWLMVAPGCVVLAVVIGVVEARPLSALWTVVAIAIVPLGALAVSDWVGILWPYRPISLRSRWQARHVMRSQLRWMVLVLVPYAVVPALLFVVALPAVGWWHLETGGVPSRLSDTLLGQLTLIASATSLLAWTVGRATSRRLLRRRRIRLRACLSDPAWS